MTERQLLRIFIFFAQGLGRVQLNKIQRAYKEQSKIRKSDAEALASRKIYLFYTALSPCSVKQDTKGRVGLAKHFCRKIGSRQGTPKSARRLIFFPKK